MLYENISKYVITVIKNPPPTKMALEINRNAATVRLAENTKKQKQQK